MSPHGSCRDCGSFVYEDGRRCLSCRWTFADDQVRRRNTWNRGMMVVLGIAVFVTHAAMGPHIFDGERPNLVSAAVVGAGLLLAAAILGPSIPTELRGSMRRKHRQRSALVQDLVVELDSICKGISTDVRGYYSERYAAWRVSGQVFCKARSDWGKRVLKSPYGVRLTDHTGVQVWVRLRAAEVPEHLPRVPAMSCEYSDAPDSFRRETDDDGYMVVWVREKNHIYNIQAYLEAAFDKAVREGPTYG